MVVDYQNIQIHGFCDASNIGYGACIYVRSCGPQGNVAVRLLCGKSRVAPLKPVTIPRLELCGALLLAQLYQEVSHALQLKIDKAVFWCDSTIVLHWLNTSPHLLKVYVANRVATVQEITGSHQWRYIKSKENPADSISREQLPYDFSQNQLWFSGPTWLTENEHDWPNESICATEVPELKKNVCFVSMHGNLDIFDRYSSYSKLLRIIAYCLRVRPTNKHTGALCVKEINEAEIRVLKLLQITRFPDKIKILSKTSMQKSKFAELNPFLDENGLIRVGGRLQKSDLTFAVKHPVLFPTRHCLTDRIIREVHENHHHTGIQTTLYNIRQRFWLPGGMRCEKSSDRVCVVSGLSPTQSNIGWEIFLQFVYAGPYRLPTLALIIADRSI
ncbi:PREDICTED: uncharacterized protein LOC108769759 [Trachymyrmex cornetzi]|uniref:uncharacterized protein LOC108769759 n=1 Tax=Trachymyrmex cornetzi TaxID=471704 RepID=UPI00084EEABF|nr:PREDICTED: uncharacterized protein LOC108769759 [Trachymyrmex cornetzi]